MQGPEKNSYKEFDNEKKFLQLENSPPRPHNFSNGPSLSFSLAVYCFQTIFGSNLFRCSTVLSLITLYAI